MNIQGEVEVVKALQIHATSNIRFAMKKIRTFRRCDIPPALSHALFEYATDDEIAKFTATPSMGLPNSIIFHCGTITLYIFALLIMRHTSPFNRHLFSFILHHQIN